MPFRFKAFALHLLASASALSLILGILYGGWYHWPGWYLTAVGKILLIMCAVDLVLGPTLTLIVANPTKARRVFARDVAIIVTVQLAALVYGAVTLWQGRPLYYTFSVNRLETVQASDLDAAQIALAFKENPALAPHWYSRPRWVWAPLPADPDKAMEIIKGATLGAGQDVIDMPRYFRPWESGLPELRGQLSSLHDIIYFSKKEKQQMETRMARLGLRPGDHNVLVMWGGAARRLLVVFDPESLKIEAMLRPD
jgi:hypothetical protein